MFEYDADDIPQMANGIGLREIALELCSIKITMRTTRYTVYYHYSDARFAMTQIDVSRSQESS